MPIPKFYGIHDTYVRDGLAFVFAWNTGVIIYDVGNGMSGGSPSSPVEVGRLVTGAAAMSDGSVIALRTYTDAYLYPVPDGDVAKALAGDPVRVPLPNEPQGEAIAFDPDGTLLSASEGAGTPIRAVAGAAALAQPPAPTTTSPPPAADQPQASSPSDSSSSSWQNWPLALTLGGLVLVAALVIGLRFRRRA